MSTLLIVLPMYNTENDNVFTTYLRLSYLLQMPKSHFVNVITILLSVNLYNKVISIGR